MFITFEGIDFSGKTTQANLLVECLQKHHKEVILLREPGGTMISEKIREILLNKEHFELTQKAELFLFSAARTQLVSEVIRPSLDTGAIVVCDRFYDSTTAYQGYGRGLNLEEVNVMNRIATSGTTPDLTLLVDIEVGEIQKRCKADRNSADRMESAGYQFFEKVRCGYLEIAKAEPSRIVVLNGMLPIKRIHDEIWKIVEPRIF